MSAALEPRSVLEHLYWVAVRRALPSETLAAYLPSVPKGRTLVIGAGKAAGAMAYAFEAAWPADAPVSGLVVTRYEHIPSRPSGLPARIEIIEAAHPVPDAASLHAAQRIRGLVEGLTQDDLVVCLISGGGSALLTLPVAGLDLRDKQRINKKLLESGADIREMNCVRKHLSRIKGGQLAAACWPAQVVTLAISDVPGDDVSVIASGPTVEDATTCSDALSILAKYAIAVPEAVKAALAEGALETPKPDDQRFVRNSVRVIATPNDSLKAAAAEAQAMGIETRILSDDIEGESRDVGKVHAALARYALRDNLHPNRPLLLLSGGETTVTVMQRPAGSSRGRGGRAGEFCMGLAHALQGEPHIWALAADTDGIDGVEDNAGAFVTPDTLIRGLMAGANLRDYLERNDAYGYFSTVGDLFTTGPTHTNVNDFRAMLIL
ncbi:glycerate kinase [Acidovorax sp. ACV01]|uniref:glycerate kinase type-2 family protein n=1 Tax=Acidovorax sp. ACV01 TaxID=2769311 RepID=UPI00177AE517|nr:glycerate kinase [Acidovorax sp. ACV01]MBD9390714.1 glycerate kinase [Acidovorax sp. ACV01]